MGITITTTTTFEAVLAPVYSDGQPITTRRLPGVEYNKAQRALERFGDRCPTQNEIVRLMLGAIETVSWIVENLPGTRIEPVDRYGEMFLIATFASEADATAFKTRWG